METLIEILNDEENKKIKEVCKYLQISKLKFTSNSFCEAIKEVCVAKMCLSIGINCKYNYKSKFFEFASRIAGEAVCKNLDIKMHIAEDCYRLVKYKNVNMVEKVRELLQNEDKDEAFIDIFHFVDSYKYLIL